jgi:hypothetical protein
MDDTQQRFTKIVLWASVVYFAACGTSAITYPVSWLVVSGLPRTALTPELEVAFGALGAYLLALAVGAGLAAINPLRHPGLILILMFGNFFDFCVTLKAVVARQLPILNGGFFLVLAMTLSVLIGIAYLYVKRTHPTR